MSSGSFKMLSTKCLEIIYLIYMYKKDLALNNLQGLMSRKPQNINHTFLSLPCCFDFSPTSGGVLVV